MNATDLFAAHRISAIPMVPRTKRPRIEWAEFQQRRPTDAERAEWHRRWSHDGVAVICGRVSDLVILDVDPGHGGAASLAPYPAVPLGPTSETGGGGWHHYFVGPGPEWALARRLIGLLPGIDFIGEGLAIEPPSIHPDGPSYRWAPGRALGEVPRSALPAWLRRLVRERLAADARPHSAGPQTGEGAPEAVLERLASVRRIRGGWIARCPAHEDKAPSLSIGVGREGRLLLHCFAGCRYAAVRAALDGAAAPS